MWSYPLKYYPNAGQKLIFSTELHISLWRSENSYNKYYSFKYIIKTWVEAWICKPLYLFLYSRFTLTPQAVVTSYSHDIVSYQNLEQSENTHLHAYFTRVLFNRLHHGNLKQAIGWQPLSSLSTRDLLNWYMYHVSTFSHSTLQTSVPSMSTTMWNISCIWAQAAPPIVSVRPLEPSWMDHRITIGWKRIVQSGPNGTGFTGPQIHVTRARMYSARMVSARYVYWTWF